MTYNEAVKSNRLMGLYIYLDGCPACKSFDSFYYEAKNKYGYKYNFVRENVNSPSMLKLCDYWNVHSFPFFAIVNPVTKDSRMIPYSCMRENTCFYNTLRDYK